MSVEAAILAVAASQTVGHTAFEAWQANAAELERLGATSNMRLAAIFGQCAHESGGFLHRFENLNYSASALNRVFRRHFPTMAIARDYARQPERIANRAYADRMGNGPESSGDGWRYRGRGYIQLTGKSNYETFGRAIGVDLVDHPDKAAEPGTAWLVAVRYMATRRRSGKSLLEWADEGADRMVTLGINGGTHGLADRQMRTARALQALSGDVPTIELQRLLLAAGFDPGPIDGLMGPRTEAARDAAERHYGVSGAALVDKLRAA